MLLIDTAWKELSNGGQFVNFDYKGPLLWNSGCQAGSRAADHVLDPFLAWSIPKFGSNQAIDRAQWELSKTTLLAFIGRLVEKIRPIVMTYLFYLSLLSELVSVLRRWCRMLQKCCQSIKSIKMSVSKSPPELSRSGQFGVVVATHKDIFIMYYLEAKHAGSTIINPIKPLIGDNTSTHYQMTSTMTTQVFLLLLTYLLYLLSRVERRGRVLHSITKTKIDTRWQTAKNINYDFDMLL